MFKKIRFLWYSLRLKAMCTSLARVEKDKMRRVEKIDKVSKKCYKLVGEISNGKQAQYD